MAHEDDINKLMHSGFDYEHVVNGSNPDGSTFRLKGMPRQSNAAAGGNGFTALPQGDAQRQTKDAAAQARITSLQNALTPPENSVAAGLRGVASAMNPMPALQTYEPGYATLNSLMQGNAIIPSLGAGGDAVLNSLGAAKQGVGTALIGQKAMAEMNQPEPAAIVTAMGAAPNTFNPIGTQLLPGEVADPRNDLGPVRPLASAAPVPTPAAISRSFPSAAEFAQSAANMRTNGFSAQANANMDAAALKSGMIPGTIENQIARLGRNTPTREQSIQLANQDAATVAAQRQQDVMARGAQNQAGMTERMTVKGVTDRDVAQINADATASGIQLNNETAIAVAEARAKKEVNPQAALGDLYKAYGSAAGDEKTQAFIQQEIARMTGAAPAAAATITSPADQQAVAWARANPNDPRSAAILKKLNLT